MAKYVLRVDDIHPKMNLSNFNRLMDIFCKYNVKPLIGVIPNNKDKSLCLGQAIEGFWNFVKDMQDRGKVDIAMHGYTHEYSTKNGGLLGKYRFKRQSEFAGLTRKEQEYKIINAKQIFIEKGLDTEIFMAPGHTFDKTTLEVLSEYGFKYITDGIGIYPFKLKKILFVPQQIANPRKFLFGTITICIHINKLESVYLDQIEAFIIKNRDDIVSFSTLTKIKKIYSKPVNALFRILYYCACRLKR